MARLSTAARKSSLPPSSESDSADSCIVLASSTASASTKSSTSTRPTSVASTISQEERALKKPPAASKKRSNDTRPTAVKRLENFGFTAVVRVEKTASSPAKLVPLYKLPRTSLPRGDGSWLDEASEEEGKTRHVSANSQTPLVGGSNARLDARSLLQVSQGSVERKDASSDQGLKAQILMGFLPPFEAQSTVRQFSGATLVDEDAGDKTSNAQGDDGQEEDGQEEDGQELQTETGQTEGEDRQDGENDPPGTVQAKIPKKRSRMEKMMGAVSATASSLGKRGRDAFERGKEKLQVGDRRKGSRILEADLKEDEPVKEPPSKKIKRTTSSAPTPSTTKQMASPASKRSSKPKKSWLNSGMYVGQSRDFKPYLSGARNKKTLPSVGTAVPLENKSLPLPMFFGEDVIRNGRDFKLPFDVFAPLPPGQPKPDEWKKTQSNRTIGDAAQAVAEWKRFANLPSSSCDCKSSNGCDEDCTNRIMFYECDDRNCRVGAEHCTNRGFAELKERAKHGNKYDIGVEVLRTDGKGFGVRACRTFNPGQIIVEYAGEMITREECERRMHEEYNENTCYYLMTFDRNLIIDATRGTIARFVNHSCAPNCQMIKWTVAGKPRMALFSGDAGIMTGEELTYDYNFDNFNKSSLTLCRCGAPNCRGVLGPKPNVQELKAAKMKAAAEEAAQKLKRAVEGLMEGEKMKKKRKKHIGWQYQDLDGNDIEEPDSDELAQQKAAKKQKTGKSAAAAVGVARADVQADDDDSDAEPSKKKKKRGSTVLAASAATVTFKSTAAAAATSISMAKAGERDTTRTARTVATHASVTAAPKSSLGADEDDAESGDEKIEHTESVSKKTKLRGKWLPESLRAQV